MTTDTKEQGLRSSEDSVDATPPLRAMNSEFSENSRRHDFDYDAPRMNRPMLHHSLSYYRSVASVLSDAALGLHHAHQHGILHRDVKPSNLMVDESEHCWIIDFGLAGYLTGEAKEQSEQHSSCDMSGKLGTLHYMAPEQFEGRADPRTDVWGLGVTLYELLAFRKPFLGQSYADIRCQIAQETPQALRKLVPGIPLDLEAICQKATSKRPQDRYHDAAEFREDLHRWLRGEPARASKSRLPRRLALWARRNKGSAAAIVLTLILTASVVTGVLQYWKGIAADAQRRAKEATALAAQRERDTQMQELQRVVLSTPRIMGWGAKATRYSETLREHNGEPRLQALLAATLYDWDARIVKSFEGLQVSSLVFDRQGTRLLMGGSNGSNGEPAVATRMWSRQASTAMPTRLRQPGPVAFKPDGTPVQLHVGPRATVELLDAGNEEVIAQLNLGTEWGEGPPQHPGFPLSILSVDAGLAAVAFPGTKDQGPIVLIWNIVNETTRSLSTEATALALSPDNRWLATGQDDGSIMVWSLQAESDPIRLAFRDVAVQSLAFGANPHLPLVGADPESLGNWLLACGDSTGQVVVWDPQRQLPLTTCRGAEIGIYAIAFSPDGMCLAAAGRYRAHLFDVASGRLLLQIPTHQNTYNALAFSTDGRHVALASVKAHEDPGCVVVVELTPGRAGTSLSGLGSAAGKVVISNDGRWVAAISHEYQLAVWDREADRLQFVLQAPKNDYDDNVGIAFDLERARIAVASGDEVRMFSLANGKLLRQWRDLPIALQNTLTFTPAGRLMLVRAEARDFKQLPYGSTGQTRPLVIRVRDLMANDPNAPVSEILECEHGAYQIALAPDGSTFITEGRNNRDRRRVAAFDTSTYTELWAFESDKVPRSALLAIDPTAAFATVDVEDELAHLLDLKTGALLRRLTPSPRHLAPGANGYFSFAPEGGIRYFPDVDSQSSVTFGYGTTRPLVQHNYCVSNDGRFLAWGTAEGTVYVVDLPEAQKQLSALGLGW